LNISTSDFGHFCPKSAVRILSDGGHKIPTAEFGQFCPKSLVEIGTGVAFPVAIARDAQGG
jgi:hypothetical protein